MHLTMNQRMRHCEQQRINQLHVLRASEMVNAISSERRLLILCLLTEREEMTEWELSKYINGSQTDLAKDLAGLVLNRFVCARKASTETYYRIANDDVHRIIDTLYGIYIAPVRL